LTQERAQPDELIRKGRRSAQLLTKARSLLKADVSELGEGWSDSRIAAALDTSTAIIERTRRQLVEEGFEAVLRRKYNPNSDRPRIFDGVAGAKLITLTLSPAPAGFARWSLRLLEEQVVELHIVERGRQHDRTDAKKNILKPHRRQKWVIPPDARAAFVANMQDVLEVYQRPQQDRIKLHGSPPCCLVAAAMEDTMVRTAPPRSCSAHSPDGRWSIHEASG
jgi:hypothetical protein